MLRYISTPNTIQYNAFTKPWRPPVCIRTHVCICIRTKGDMLTCGTRLRPPKSGRTKCMWVHSHRCWHLLIACCRICTGLTQPQPCCKATPPSTSLIRSGPCGTLMRLDSFPDVILEVHLLMNWPMFQPPWKAQTSCSLDSPRRKDKERSLFRGRNLEGWLYLWEALTPKKVWI